MSSKVTITRSKLDNLADVIAYKAGISTCMNISRMRTAVQLMYGSREYYGLRDELVLKTYSDNIHISQATVIPDYAMAGLKNIEFVYFPSATQIGKAAFAECSNLSDVSIPNATKIGDSAFQSCKALLSINFESVANIGNYAFQNCKNLSEFSGGAVQIVGSHAFENCKSLSTPSFLMKSEGIAIGAYAFTNCQEISQAIINSVGKYIEYTDKNDILWTIFSGADYAFESCSALSYVSMVSSIYYVPEGMFRHCSNLSSIFGIGKYIGSYAFDGCVNLNPRPSNSSQFFPNWFSEGAFRSTLIDYLSSPYGFETNGPSSIPSYMFANCQQLSYINFGLVNTSDLKYIGNYAFDSCINLNTINFVTNVQEIGDYAFNNCHTLTSLGLGAGSNIKKIGWGAFENCERLSSVSLKNTNYIGSYAFHGCTSLTGVISVNDSCSQINPHTFEGCKNITSFYGSGVTNIHVAAFKNCINLSSITYGQGYYTSIYEEAFYSCPISTFDLKNVKQVGASTFGNCSLLTNITGPSVREIGSNAFRSCFLLSSISFPLCSTIGAYAFASCSSLTTAYLPSCTFVGNFAFSYCKNLSSITLNSNCSFSNYAFWECSKLSSFDLQNASVIPQGLFCKCEYYTGGMFEGLSVVYANSITSIASQAFAQCGALMSLYLLTDSSTPIKMPYYSVGNAMNPFYSTPMLSSVQLVPGGQFVYGKIYVRSSMYSKLQSSSAWSALFTRGVMTIYEN